MLRIKDLQPGGQPGSCKLLSFNPLPRLTAGATSLLSSLARGLLGPRLYFSALAYISRRGRERLRVHAHFIGLIIFSVNFAPLGVVTSRRDCVLRVKGLHTLLSSLLSRSEVFLRIKHVGIDDHKRGWQRLLLNFQRIKEVVIGLLELSEGSGVSGEFGGEGEDRFHGETITQTALGARIILKIIFTVREEKS